MRHAVVAILFGVLANEAGGARTFEGGQPHTVRLPLVRSGHAGGEVPIEAMLASGFKLKSSGTATPAAANHYVVTFGGRRRQIEKLDDFRGFLVIKSAASAIWLARWGTTAAITPNAMDKSSTKNYAITRPGRGTETDRAAW